ncbi:MAG TPA: hypothetical protein VJO52_01525 [Gemmatimonadaceae bacterium]|nr:hypothetical protein [Gemmatimonadaceae bacterium]
MTDPSGTFVPPRVVDATRAPENSPRATSYVLVTICVERIASCGTDPEPKLSPPSVTELAVGRRPATENWVPVESVASMPATLGANVASALRSLASTGRRAAISDGMSRLVEPGVRWLPRPSLRRAWTLTGGQPLRRGRHLHVAHQTILVRLARHSDNRRRHSDESNGDAVLSATIRGQNRVSSLVVRVRVPSDFGFHRHRFDVGTVDRMTEGIGDGSS